ncbi:cupin domain-containing protein [Laceyella tengchongensis]
MRKYKVTEMDVKPLVDKGGEVRVMMSPKTVDATQLIMGTATVPVGTTVKKHVHDYGEECFYVLQGKGVLYLEGVEGIEFSAGEALIVPKGVPHSIENTGKEQIKVVFATAPLAPTAQAGHRNMGGNGHA